MRALTLTLLITYLSLNSFSQITVTQDDMPEVNDTFRISTNTSFTIDPSLTGEDYFWDFSSLSYESQTVDTFVHVNDAPFSYNLVFVYPFISTIAKPSDAPETPDVVPLEITESYDFFKESATEFIKVGFAAKINGIPTPKKYDNPELLYSFPLTYGNSVDSSTSTYDIEVPTYGLYGQTIKRVNEVDGWGTVVTPYGSFECIRIKSLVYQRDTFYLESMSMGYAIDRPLLTEYKWMANGMGIPVLQIDDSNLVTLARYQDSLRQDPLLVNEDRDSDFFNVFPNPVEDQLIIQFKDQIRAKIKLSLIDNKGTIILQQNINWEEADQTYKMMLSDLNLSAGIYNLLVQIDGRIFQKTVFVRK